MVVSINVIGLPPVIHFLRGIFQWNKPASDFTVAPLMETPISKIIAKHHLKSAASIAMPPPPARLRHGPPTKGTRTSNQTQLPGGKIGPYKNGGFHRHGGTPRAGWFLLGKIPSRNGWCFGGTPILRKPPYHLWPGWFMMFNDTVDGRIHAAPPSVETCWNPIKNGTKGTKPSPGVEILPSTVSSFTVQIRVSTKLYTKLLSEVDSESATFWWVQPVPEPAVCSAARGVKKVSLKLTVCLLIEVSGIVFVYMRVSINGGTPKSSILMGFSL